MADQKISALPAVVTVDPTDEFGVNQAGTSKKVSVSQLLPVFVGASSVKDYGAVGDGITDDTDAINNALTAAGTGGTVQFTKGKTYLISHKLLPVNGQTLTGYGAVIKRRNQITTTTTTGITNGVTTSVTLTSATGFAVGMQIDFGSSVTPRISWSTSPGSNTMSSNSPAITAISGNTITLSVAPDVTLPSGALAFLSFNCIKIPIGGTRVLGLEFNGNKSNWTINRWEITNEIKGYGTGGAPMIVEDCYFHDAPGDVMQTAGIASRISNCRVQNVNGNGVHLFAATHPVVERCWMQNGNLDLSNGHVDGGIIHSNQAINAIITDNYVENFQYMSEVRTVDDSSVLIANNIAVNCWGGGMSIGAPGVGGGNVENVIVTNNQFLGCGTSNLIYGTGIYFNQVTGKGLKVTNNLLVSCSIELRGADDGVADNVDLSGNTIRDGSIRFWRMINSRISDNVINNGQIQFYGTVSSSEVSRNLIDNSINTTTTCIQFTGSDNSNNKIANNTLIGGVIGMSITGAGVTDLKVTGNLFRGNKTYGLVVTNSSTTASGVLVADNQMETTTASVTWAGLKILNTTGVQVIGNRINNTLGSSYASYGIRIDTGTSNVIARNSVTGTYNFKQIGILSTSTGAAVVENITDEEVDDLGTSTFRSGNRNFATNADFRTSAKGTGAIEFNKNSGTGGAKFYNGSGTNVAAVTNAGAFTGTLDVSQLTGSGGIIAGANITVTGTFPNQTVSSTAVGSGNVGSTYSPSTDGEVVIFSGTGGQTITGGGTDYSKKSVAETISGARTFTGDLTGVVFTKSITGVSFTATGITAVFTVPAGKTFICTRSSAIITSVSGYSSTTLANWKIQNAAGTAISGNNAVTSTWDGVNEVAHQLIFTGVTYGSAGAGTAVNLNVTAASSSTTLVCTVFVTGYYL